MADALGRQWFARRRRAMEGDVALWGVRRDHLNTAGVPAWGGLQEAVESLRPEGLRPKRYLKYTSWSEQLAKVIREGGVRLVIAAQSVFQEVSNSERQVVYDALESVGGFLVCGLGLFDLSDTDQRLTLALYDAYGNPGRADLDCPGSRGF